MKKKIKILICGLMLFALTSSFRVHSTYADAGISVSPMYEKIILTPGEVYEGSFTLSNSDSNDETLNYGVSILPFYLNDNNEVSFEANGNYGQIVDWISVDETAGSITPNQSRTIQYKVNVPLDAPAGGQYAAIKVGSLVADTVNKENSINIDVTYGVGYLIYAEVLGSTIRSGEIADISVSSFLTSGNIVGASSIKNTGNVHGTAKYTLQVYPLFGGEEFFTNEEDVATRTIIPEQTIYNETAWPDTPAVGIFNVVYTVEFEGVTQQVKKMVIKCPIWLLFIIIFAIIALIIFIILKAKNRGKKGSRAKASE